MFAWSKACLYFTVETTVLFSAVEKGQQIHIRDETPLKQHCHD